MQSLGLYLILTVSFLTSHSSWRLLLAFLTWYLILVMESSALWNSGCWETVLWSEKKGRAWGTVGGECFLWNHWHTFIMPFSLIVIAMKGQVVQYGCLWYRWYLDFSYSNDRFLKVNATYMSFTAHSICPLTLSRSHLFCLSYEHSPRETVINCWSLNYCLGWGGCRILRKQQWCQGVESHLECGSSSGCDSQWELPVAQLRKLP